MVYSNCIDHAFNLSQFFQEHARVLKPGGCALYDINISEQRFGAFEAWNGHRTKNYSSWRLHVSAMLCEWRKVEVGSGCCSVSKHWAGADYKKIFQLD